MISPAEFDVVWAQALEHYVHWAQHYQRQLTAYERISVSLQLPRRTLAEMLVYELLVAQDQHATAYRYMAGPSPHHIEEEGHRVRFWSGVQREAYQRRLMVEAAIRELVRW